MTGSAAAFSSVCARAAGVTSTRAISSASGVRWRMPWLLLHELDAAVLRAARLARVVGDRVVVGESGRGEAVGGDGVLLDEIRLHRRGAIGRELAIGRLGAGVVRVALDLELEGAVFREHFGDRRERLF